jgi:hypothetical protein
LFLQEIVSEINGKTLNTESQNLEFSNSKLDETYLPEVDIDSINPQMPF